MDALVDGYMDACRIVISLGAGICQPKTPELNYSRNVPSSAYFHYWSCPVAPGGTAGNKHY